MLSDLADYVRAGVIKPIVDAIHPMSGVADAHRAMEAGGRRGKQIIRMT